MINKSFFNYIKITFLFICLLYGLVPFEASSFDESFHIHAFFLSLIAMYAFYSNNFKISKYSSIFLIVMTFITLLLFFVSYGRAIYPFMFTLVFVSFVVPALYNNFDFKYNFTKALLILICVSIFMTFLQTFVFILTNNVLLLHEVVFPFSHARIGEEAQFNNLTRMGGMYIEPGTYSNYMFLLITLYMFLKKKFIPMLILFSAISIFLTYSLWGMMFATYLMLLLFFIKFVEISWKGKLYLLIMLIGLLYYTIPVIENSTAVQFAITKMNRNTDERSVSPKKQAYELYKSSFENLFLVGDGFAPKIREKVPSLQDAGLLLNIAIVFGFLLTMLFVVIYVTLFFKLSNIAILLASLPVFMSKLFYWDPGLWLLFFLLIYSYLVRNLSIQENK